MAIDTQDMEVGRGDDIEHDSGLFDGASPHPEAVAETYEMTTATAAEPRSDTLVYEVTAEFPAERGSPGCARRLVVAALQEWGCGGALVDDAALVVTELASNVVLHAGTPLSISVRVLDSMLHVAVCDGVSPHASGSDGWMTPQPLHGLDLIDAISTRWGVECVPGGKVVWAELVYDAHPIRRFKPCALA
jgi:hypothetical protein